MRLLGRAAGRQLHALAHNRDPRRVTSGRRRRSIGGQRAMGRRGPKTPEALDATLVALVDRIGPRLRAARRVCRTVILRLRFDDFTRATRSHTLAQATAESRAILAAARELLAGATHGLLTVGQVAQYPETTLVRMLGRAAGRQLHALAHNRDPRRVTSGRRRRSIGGQRAMGRRGPKTPEALDATLVALVDRIGRRLPAARRVCRTVILRLRFDDFTRDALAHTCAGDGREPRHPRGRARAARRGDADHPRSSAGRRSRTSTPAKRKTPSTTSAATPCCAPAI